MSYLVVTVLGAVGGEIDEAANLLYSHSPDFDCLDMNATDEPVFSPDKTNQPQVR